jgi:hypothetical protein
MPDEEPIVATPGALEIHVPPVVPSVNVIVDPLQMDDDPLIEATLGNGLTVIIFVPVPEHKPLESV